MNNYLIIGLVLLVVIYVLTNHPKIEKFSDTKINNFKNTLAGKTDAEKTEIINGYIDGLKLGDSSNPIMHNFYLDERSSAMLNAIPKANDKAPEHYPSVLLPNVQCKNGAATCANEDLELTDPVSVELRFKNKPFANLSNPLDTRNYCHKDIIDCSNPENLCLFSI